MTTSSDVLKAAEFEVVEEQQSKERLVNEEFKIWKKSVPLLYDIIYTHALDFPSLSVQWLPDYTLSDNKNNITVKFLYGTNTSSHSQDYLKLASVMLPSTLAPDFSSFLPNTQTVPIPLSNTDNGSVKFKVLSSWKHEGEINRLKLSPNSENVLIFDNQGMIHLFDLNSKNTIEFKYHKSEGYALDWINDKSFLSGANDSQIALWDVSKPSTPIQLFKSHSAAVNDISLNRSTSSIFGSVSDDHTTQIHDSRVVGSPNNPAITIENKQIQNCLQFHPDIDTLFATGGKDNVVSLYDLRNPNVPIRSLFGHHDTVIGLKWDSVHNPDYLYSWGLDKRSIRWDIKNLDEEFIYPTKNHDNSKKKNSSKVDPCLSFIHGGHTNRVNDLDSHPKISNLFISVGDDNLLEVWKPKTIRYEDEGEDDESEVTNNNSKKDSQDDSSPKSAESQTKSMDIDDSKSDDPSSKS